MKTTKTITQHSVPTLLPPPGPRAQIFYWDSAMTGFGVCVSATGRRTFVVQARIRRANRTRRVVLGQWPEMTVEQARNAARPLLLEFKAGRDLQQSPRPAITLGEFIPLYLAYAQAHKPRSWHRAAGDLRRYLPGAWSARPLDQFTRADMAQLHIQLKARGDYASNGFLRLLQAMFNWARNNGGQLPETALNPVRGLKWFKEHTRERYLTPDEYERLQGALDREPFWRDYFRLLLMTAQRLSECAGMRWDEVDFTTATWTLPASRTKARRATRVPLTRQALAILAARRAAAVPLAVFVFPSPRRAGVPIVDPQDAWQRIRARAGIPADVRIHDLRRTAASFLVAGGASLPLIGRLLNHQQPTTTAVYARLDLEPVRAALQQQEDKLDRLNGKHTRGVGAEWGLLFSRDRSKTYS